LLFRILIVPLAVVVAALTGWAHSADSARAPERAAPADVAAQVADLTARLELAEEVLSQLACDHWRCTGDPS
jgi:hypothetical protein